MGLTLHSILTNFCLARPREEDQHCDPIMVYYTAQWGQPNIWSFLIGDKNSSIYPCADSTSLSNQQTSDGSETKFCCPKKKISHSVGLFPHCTGQLLIFCWCTEIYLPIPPHRRPVSMSPAFPWSRSLVWRTVPDILTSIDLLWMWGPHLLSEYKLSPIP